MGDEAPSFLQIFAVVGIFDFQGGIQLHDLLIVVFLVYVEDNEQLKDVLELVEKGAEDQDELNEDDAILPDRPSPLDELLFLFFLHQFIFLIEFIEFSLLIDEVQVLGFTFVCEMSILEYFLLYFLVFVFQHSVQPHDEFL